MTTLNFQLLFFSGVERKQTGERLRRRKRLLQVSSPAAHSELVGLRLRKVSSKFHTPRDLFKHFPHIVDSRSCRDGHGCDVTCQVSALLFVMRCKAVNSLALARCSRETHSHSDQRGRCDTSATNPDRCVVNSCHKYCRSTSSASRCIVVRRWSGMQSFMLQYKSCCACAIGSTQLQELLQYRNRLLNTFYSSFCSLELFTVVRHV